MGGGGGKLADDEAAAAAPELEQQMKALAGSNMMRYYALYEEAVSVGFEQAGQPRMFHEALLNLDDAKAAMLNDMVKRYRQDELELKKRSRVIQQEVNKAFHGLMVNNDDD